MKGEKGRIFFEHNDEFRRKVDRTVTTTTHKFVRFMGRLGFRVGVSASYSKTAVWLKPANPKTLVEKYQMSFSSGLGEMGLGEMGRHHIQCGLLSRSRAVKRRPKFNHTETFCRRGFSRTLGLLGYTLVPPVGQWTHTNAKILHYRSFRINLSICNCQHLKHSATQETLT